jgi:hypothetical protein
MSRTGSSQLSCYTTERLDSATLAYVAAAEPCFADLRRVAAQLAGLLVLQASGARSAGPGHPMVAVAAELLAASCDAALSLVPRTERARHHHHHLLSAAERLSDTLAGIRTTRVERADVTAPTQFLMTAWSELGHASRALPGFELVDFSEACCAQHATFKRSAA